MEAPSTFPIQKANSSLSRPILSPWHASPTHAPPMEATNGEPPHSLPHPTPMPSRSLQTSVSTHLWSIRMHNSSAEPSTSPSIFLKEPRSATPPMEQPQPSIMERPPRQDCSPSTKPPSSVSASSRTANCQAQSFHAPTSTRTVIINFLSSPSSPTSMASMAMNTASSCKEVETDS